MRVAPLCFVVALTGCASLRPPDTHVQPPPVTAPVRPVGRPPEKPRAALDELRAAAQPDTPPVKPPDDPLQRVADCLERDDPLGAAGHLETYLTGHADQHLFRFQLAELYLRADRPAHARGHLERFAADAQTGPPSLRPHLVTAHIKLRELAVAGGDPFGEPFHRGVGLLLLVREQDGARDRDALFCEEMLCKALKALEEAKALRPGDARVRAYLSETYERAGNRHAADAERAAARADVVGGTLTAPERGALGR